MGKINHYRGWVIPEEVPGYDPKKHCSQCGKDILGRAFGPTHAVLRNELKKRKPEKKAKEGV